MFNKKSLKSLVGFVILIAAVIIAGCWLYSNVINKSYSVLSTTSGEFYVGKLSHMPFSHQVKLTNAFILQSVRTQEFPDGKLTLIPLESQSLWLPEAIYFNKRNIVFSGRVGEGSEVAIIVKQYDDAMKASPNGVAPVPQQPVAPVAPAAQ